MVPNQPTMMALRLKEAVSIPICKATGHPNALRPCQQRTRPSEADKADLIPNETTAAQEDEDENKHHHNTREERTDACTQQAKLRKAQMTVASGCSCL